MVASSEERCMKVAVCEVNGSKAGGTVSPCYRPSLTERDAACHKREK